MPKPIYSLQVTDFMKNAVWRFTDSDEPDETYVSRVRKFPLAECDGCIIGTEIELSNGDKLVGFVGNLNPKSPSKNEHFLTLSVFREDGTLFHLARYHDTEYKKHGPEKLAKFLGLRVADIFPTSFTIPRTILGTRGDYRGILNREPSKKLTSEELIDLSLE